MTQPTSTTVDAGSFIYRWSRAESAEIAARLAELEPAGVYMDRRTGWVGRVRLPENPRKTIKAPEKNGRTGLALAKVPLEGASAKADQAVEIRLAFVDDLEPADGDPVGFGELP
jgi:hypothetical protein